MMTVYRQVRCFVQYLVEKMGLLRRLGNSFLMTAILLEVTVQEGNNHDRGRRKADLNYR